MKQIRNNIFETNSSSTHSISISRIGVLSSISLTEPLVLNGGEFSWEWERYNDWLTKANYLAQSASSRNNHEHINMLRDVIMEQTGAPDVLVNATGYINHQSSAVAIEVFNSKDDIRDFIFNTSSYLFTGNDNEDEPDLFYEPDDVVYTHQLTFSDIGFDKYIKLSGLPSKLELKKHIEKLWEQYKCDNSNNLSFYRLSHCNDWLNLDNNEFSVQLDCYNRHTKKCETQDIKNIKFKIEKL